MQLRSATKDVYPSRRETTATGHSKAGEQEITAAIRELYEEAGVVLSEQDVELVEVFPLVFQAEGINNREHVYQYVAKVPQNVETSVTEQQVDQVRWFSISDVRSLLQQSPDKFVAYEEFSPGYRERVL